MSKEYKDIDIYNEDGGTTVKGRIVGITLETIEVEVENELPRFYYAREYTAKERR